MSVSVVTEVCEILKAGFYFSSSGLYKNPLRDKLRVLSEILFLFSGCAPVTMYSISNLLKVQSPPSMSTVEKNMKP